MKGVRYRVVCFLSTFARPTFRSGVGKRILLRRRRMSRFRHCVVTLVSLLCPSLSTLFFLFFFLLFPQQITSGRGPKARTRATAAPRKNRTESEGKRAEVASPETAPALCRRLETTPFISHRRSPTLDNRALSLAESVQAKRMWWPKRRKEITVERLSDEQQPRRSVLHSTPGRPRRPIIEFREE